MMAMVFTNVQADIADDLPSMFPQDFDFFAMLKKVSDDAGVVIETGLDVEEARDGKYRMKGSWLPMEKAYKNILTSLALYGDGSADTPFSSNIALPEGTDFSSSDFVPDVKSLISHLELQPVEKKSFEQSTLAPEKRQRRPRKSSLQSRKFTEVADLDDIVIESVEDDLIDTVGLEAAAECTKIEEKATSVCDDKGDTANEEVLTEKDIKEEAVPRKRGRPRKGAPIRVLKKTKKVTNRKKSVIPEASEDPDENSSVKKQAKTKVNGDSDSVKVEWPCKECNFIGTKRSLLRSHRLKMHLAAPTKCDVCQKIFPNKRYMLRHRASHVAPQHCCDICGKMYKIRNSMVEHRKTHDAGFKKDKAFCQLCPKSFCNRYVLDCHIRDVHMGLKKSFLCSVCGKSFTSRHSLKEHSDAHIGIKPHTCEICGKSFSYESALRDHKFTHANSKTFWCTHCQKGFSQRSGLKMHMRIHKQNKLFVCSECGRGFTQKQALQRHERVHKGEKPFICKQCGRFFTDASIIRRHLILVHKIHKDANSWREDIISTVKSLNENHVQKIGDDPNTNSEAEKVKEEILKVVGAQVRPPNKGPSKAFSRRYPRRVALLDEEGNVIAPPEVATTSLDKVVTSSETAGAHKSKTLMNPPTVTTLLAPETNSDVDSNSLNASRFLESPWDTLTGQLRAGGTNTHIDHIILDDAEQHEIQRGLDQVSGLHKVIKYESVQGLPSIAISNPAHILNPSHSQASPSPCMSPVSFTPQVASHSRGLDAQFETIAPQAAHTTNQFYENRSGSHGAAPAQWSSMFYYSQLASQFGMSITSDYPYVSSGNASASGHLGVYSSHGVASEPQTGPSPALILTQGQSAVGDSPSQVDLQEEGSSHIPITVTATSGGHLVPAGHIPEQTFSSEILSSATAPPSSTGVRLPNHSGPTGLKLTSHGTLHHGDLLLHEDLASVVDGRQSSPMDNKPDMVGIELGLGQQTLLARPLDVSSVVQGASSTPTTKHTNSGGIPVPRNIGHKRQV